MAKKPGKTNGRKSSTAKTKGKTISAKRLTARPWTVKGVQVETVAAAKKAAKRDGVFLGAWVDRTLRDAATDRLKETPVPAIPADDVMTLLSELTSMEKAKGGRPEKTGETTEPVKVDQLSKRGFFSRMFGG